MTTIATDGITIAADGRTCGDGIIFAENIRKIIVEDQVIYAMAGTRAFRRPLINWIKSGAEPEKLPPSGSEWSLLVISAEHGLVRYTKTTPYAEQEPYPCSEGSGWEWALAAMKLGKTPEEAVRFAAQFDTRTGGELMVVNIAEALGLQPALRLVGGQ